MKATFLISTPRSGTLALANIMNTDSCIAHHEGNDFDLIRKNNNIPFLETYAGKQLTKACQEGKNYFCCDQSMSGLLMIKLYHDESARQYFKDHSIQLQSILLGRNYLHSAKSYGKLMGFTSDIQILAIAQSIMSEEKWKCQELGTRLFPREFSGFTARQYIYDEVTFMNRFNDNFICEVSDFVGANLGDMSYPEVNKRIQTYYSLTKSQLTEMSNQIERLAIDSSNMISNN